MILILTSKHRIIKVLILIVSTISFCVFTYYRTMALENSTNDLIIRGKKIEYSSSEKNSSIKKVNEENKIINKKESSNIKNDNKSSAGNTKNKEMAVNNNITEVANQHSVLLALPANGRISSFFGYRRVQLNDGTVEAGMHKGIDIAVPLGTKIGAAMNGEVEFAGVQEGYGNVIILKHSGGFETVYGHCSSIEVNKGDIVDTSKEIGKAGSTGRSTGPHIHFEVRYNGVAVDPLKYLNNNIVNNK